MMNKKKYLDKARAKVFRMYPKEAINHDDAHRDAQTHSDGSMSVKKIPSMIKKSGDKHLHLHMKSYHKEKDGQDFAKKHGYKVKNYVKTPSGTRMDIHKEAKTFDYFDNRDDAHAHAKKHGGKVFVNTGKGNTKVKGKRINTHVVIKKEEVKEQKIGGYNVDNDILIRRGKKYHKTIDNLFSRKSDAEAFAKKHDGFIIPQAGNRFLVGLNKVTESVDEALNLQQRMKRSRLMKRLKSRIKIGRDRARRKMANKKTLEKRSMRQARAQLAKKLTRGIPKGELTFARKKEIEKRLEKPALQQRIKRLAKRMFKDVRKKEVQRKKG